MTETQRVEIYLGPFLRNKTPDGKLEDKLRTQLKMQGIKSSMIIGNPSYSFFDYAVENLDKLTAERIVKSINNFEGYAAKAVDYVS